MRFKKRNSILAALLLAACAHQIPPGGGPDDKTPPSVHYTTPGKGSVGVSKTVTITIVFSEWIQQLNPEKCVIMFPPPPGGIKVSASGKKLIVKPRQALADSTTYHLSLNTTLFDLHGNSIGTPYDLVFSTGPTIDSGRVFGCVVTQDGKVLQPKVALFPSVAVDSSDTVLFGSPSYLTQTDSSGFYSFDNIHRGTYDCVAFADDNNNNRLDPGREQAFGPVMRHIVLDKVVGPLPLYPVVCDTAAMRIGTLKPVSGACISGEWTGGLALDAPAWDKAWHIDAVEKARNVPVKEYVPVLHSRKFFLLLGDTLGLASFKLFSIVKSPLARGKKSVFGDTIRFNGVAAADTVPPAVKSAEPQGSVELKPAIRLIWSKPVTPRFTKWYCVDSLGDSVAVRTAAGYADTMVFSLAQSLVPDSKYEMKFPDSLFRDICGNSPADSLGIRIGFRTISDRELCLSLSGGIPCLKSDTAKKWMFMPVGSSRRFLTQDNGGRFRFDSIPAGKGTMTLFTDVNHDGLLTKGSLTPWIGPEPFRTYPDTIEARKNWDIDGVTLTGACEECSKQSAPKPSADTTKTK